MADDRHDSAVEATAESDAIPPEELEGDPQKVRRREARRVERQRERAAEGEAPQYSAERLLAESGDFLGVESHVLAGAFALAGNKKNYTLQEARQAVDAFLSHEAE